MKKKGSILKDDKKKVKVYILLHAILFIFSLSTVCSKMAGRYKFLSAKFLLFYAFMIVILGIYAIAWQQIIKRIPLMVAYANKAVTVIWGIVWGNLFFGERLSLRKVIGATIIIVGIIVFSTGQEIEQ